MQLILPIIAFSLLSGAIFTLGRVFFYYRYSDKRMRPAYQKDLFKAHVLGIRFDLKNIASVNFFPLVLAIVAFFFPVLSFSFYIIILVYYFLALIAFLTMIITDYFFYSYFSDRINYLIWGLIDDDLKALLITIWKDYNVIGYLSGILFLLVCVFAVLKLVLLSAFIPIFHSLWSFLLIWIVLVVLNIIFTRGTLRHMPLSVKHAYVSEHAFLNSLCNNPVTLMYYMMKMRKKSKNNKEFETPLHQDFNKVKEVISPHSNASTVQELMLRQSTSYEQKRPPHVVVFMMESFGSQFLIEDKEARKLLGSLEPHFDQDHVFYNFLSDANGTAESFASLIANMMMLPFANALTESQYLNQLLPSSVAALYKQSGYETMAAYGGLLSWRNIGKFLESQGFDHIKGEKNITHELGLDEKSDIGNEWGLYDGHLIDYVSQYLQKATTPQFIVVLSTTNHPPFSTDPSFEFANMALVEKYQNRFLRSDEALKRFKVYEYCNDALGRFVSTVKESHLAEETVIAITGDHAYRGYKTSDQEMFLKSAVPFYLYAPSEALARYTIDTSKFGSHKDIMPTLIELTLPDTSYYAIGHSMLSNVNEGVAFNSTGLAANKDGAVLLGSQAVFYQFEEGLYTKSSQKNESLEHLLYQYYASIDATALFLKG
ncbi:LTA synthase family protein [Fangia hongkongensis]|uniref:LTA synthase family protein n=1 Tax=Fangia hongkongensis TaxID=270495 RepID=UPI00036555AE|nr:LTA synthase family protein [Fangia hongkongensis]MBK2126049.1 sulfatase-like hydrolase/transferase [Fangia hongkongensis]